MIAGRIIWYHISENYIMFLQYMYNMVAKLGKDIPVKILAIISNILENRFKYTCTWAANANFYLRF